MRPTELPSTARTLEHAAESGSGSLAVEQLGGNTFVTRLRANSPLKLLSPDRGSRAAWIIAGSYGGGLVAGDHLRLHAHAGAGTSLFLGTQASTKIYRSTGGQSCRQELSLHAEAGSICVIAPDPVTPFTDSIFEQRQRISLAADASLVLIDWFTAGRCASGERWAFSRYSSRTDVFLAGRHVFRDALLLDKSHGPLAGSCRTGRFGCFATVLIIGAAVEARAIDILGQIERAPLPRDAPVVFAASPICPAGGVVLRVAGNGPEAVGRSIRDRLSFIPRLLGDDPWARKW